MDEEKVFNLCGFITDIGEIQQIRRTTKPDILKRTVSVVTEDNQKVFMEIRNASIKELQREGVENNSYVNIDFVFEGSEKNGKKYNNIIIRNIELIK